MTQEEQKAAAVILDMTYKAKEEFCKVSSALLGAAKIAALKYRDKELQQIVDVCDKAFLKMQEYQIFANAFIKETSEVKNGEANSAGANGRSDVRNVADHRVQDELQDESGSR